MPSGKHRANRGGGFVNDTSFVQPTAYIDGSSTVDDFSYIGNGVLIDANCSIGSKVLICDLVRIGSNSTIGDNVTIECGNVIPPNSVIPNNAFFPTPCCEETLPPTPPPSPIGSPDVLLNQNLVAANTVSTPVFEFNKYYQIKFTLRQTAGLTAGFGADVVLVGPGGTRQAENQYDVYSIATLGHNAAQANWKTFGIGPQSQVDGVIDIRTGAQRIMQWRTWLLEGGAGPVRYIGTASQNDTQNDANQITFNFDNPFTGDVLVEGIGLYNQTVMPIGDSITFGTGSTSTFGYRKTLIDLHPNWRSVGPVNDLTLGPTNRNVRYHDGIAGQTTQNVIAGSGVALKPLTLLWSENGPSNNVFLMLGVADAVLTPISDTQYAANMQQIVDYIRGQTPNVRIFVGGPTNVATGAPAGVIASVNSYRAILPGAMIGRPQVVYVPMPFMPDADFFDTSHPNDAGYAIITNAWQTAVLASGVP